MTSTISRVVAATLSRLDLAGNSWSIGISHRTNQGAANRGRGPLMAIHAAADSGILFADQMVQAMSADKLGRFMTSEVFLARANAAVAKAVHWLEEQGTRPPYVQRSQSHEPEAQPNSPVAGEPERARTRRQ